MKNSVDDNEDWALSCDISELIITVKGHPYKYLKERNKRQCD